MKALQGPLSRPRLANQIWGTVSPEHRTFNPADQSVDKSPRTSQAASESSAAARDSREKSGEGSPLLKTSGETVGGASADLFGVPADRQPEAKINRLNLYESMSRRHGNGTRLPSQDSAALYENCLKCRAERCQPPPRVTPADTRGIVFARSALMKSQEAAPHQEPHPRPTSGGSQSEDRPGEGGKGPLQSFRPAFGVYFFSSSLL